MTKQDYELIAKVMQVIRSHKADIDNVDHALDVVSRSLAGQFAQRNPLFDEDKFLVASGHTQFNTQEKEN